MIIPMRYVVCMCVFSSFLISCDPKVNQRGPAVSQSCIAMLKQIEGAKATWAMEFNKNNDDSPNEEDLYGTNRYIRMKLECPEGGAYTIGKVGEKPKCTVEGHSL